MMPSRKAGGHTVRDWLVGVATRARMSLCY